MLDSSLIELFSDIIISFVTSLFIIRIFLLLFSEPANLPFFFHQLYLLSFPVLPALWPPLLLKLFAIDVLRSGGFVTIECLLLLGFIVLMVNVDEMGYFRC